MRLRADLSPVFRKGEIIASPSTGVKIQVLGGPNYIYNDHYYTIRYLDYPQERLRLKTRLATTLALQAGARQGISPLWKPNTIVEGHCPECDEEEMIFYEGDYICAWCREHLEDVLL